MDNFEEIFKEIISNIEEKGPEFYKFLIEDINSRAFNSREKRFNQIYAKLCRKLISYDLNK